MKLRMAYSPCPNDTSMFHDVAAGLLSRYGYEVSVHLHDVETLNRLALDTTYDITKISFHAYLLVRQHYQLLNSGAALGFGCGPLLVSKAPMADDDVSRCRIAVPGELTTAHLLLRLWAPNAQKKIFVPYDRVMDLIRTGEADCGILIHESRFVYQQAGLTCIVDLGEWWEQETGQPIPLGCIVARKSLGTPTIAELDQLLRRAIVHSRARPEESAQYVRDHARETDETVIQKHIKMFVTDFSVDLGGAGHAAVAVLEAMAQKAGVIP
ncbi:MAG: 1,4-dihydroxy-6-naphthoate synthase [bacterium]